MSNATATSRATRRDPSLASLSRRTKQKIRNGADVLPNLVDGRTFLAKRHRQLINQLVADQGGAQGLSEIRFQLLCRFAGAAILAEQVKQKILKEQLVPLDDYSLLISSLVRVASKVGIDRIPKNVTPSLRTYLENRPTEEPDDDREDD